jgi:RNA polymerase-binding transcription factor DksA
MNADVIAIDAIRTALRARLNEVRGRLSAALATTPDASMEAIAGEVRDLGDESVAAERTEVRHALIGRDVGEIGELEAALLRLDSGGYGRCSECDLDIEANRLRAQPAACRCGHCQAEFERRRARSGRH